MPGLSRRFKHVHVFKDRNGGERIYYRAPGAKAIPLPGPIGCRDFLSAYDKAVRGEQQAPETPAEVTRVRLRLKTAITETMAAEGVYLLMLGGEVVYVGTSQNCAVRIANHRASGKPFDRAFYIFCEDADRRVLEASLIRKLRPRGNGVIPGAATALRNSSQKAD